MAKPVVDGLEHRNRGRLEVARVELDSPSGRAFAARYDIARIPAYVLLAPDGSVRYWQLGGRPDTARIEAALSN